MNELFSVKVTASTLELNSNWPSSILECKQHWVNRTSTLLVIKLVITTWHSKVHAPKLCSPGILTSLTWITHIIESKMLEQLMNICFDLIFQLDITEWQTIETNYMSQFICSVLRNNTNRSNWSLFKCFEGAHRFLDLPQE